MTLDQSIKRCLRLCQEKNGVSYIFTRGIHIFSFTVLLNGAMLHDEPG